MSRRLAIGLAVAAGLLGCKEKPAPAATPPPAADPATAETARALAAIVASCAQAVGEVQVRRVGQTDWEPAGTGSVFRAGDVVRTGPGAFARVEFLAGGGLEVEENTSLVVDTAPAPPEVGAPAGTSESRVSVETGVVRGFLPAAGTGEAPLGIVIKTSEGEETRIAARPGEKRVAFRLTRGKDGTEVAVTKGEARVKAKGAEKVLRSGQAVDVAGGAVGEVVQLLDFPASVEPGIDARFLWKKGLAIHVAWKPVEGATGYRIQIARDLAFQGLEKSEDLAGTEAAFEPREEGVYAWRVASRDASGRYGEYGFARRIYCEGEPPRDLLVGPLDGAVVKYADTPPPVAFTWQSAGDAGSYRLVVVRGRDLSAEPAVSRSTPEQRLEIEGLTAGEYVWGVYVDDRRQAEPIFVRPRVLVVQKVDKPKVKVPRTISEWGKQ
ncbi:MAG TPA: hypothetical protein VLS93_15525 [Anaeromyxobacteraceae bacterium]|nr:hypothetical protein [Anaeromyxobacteraceae bacterium]